MKNKKTIFILFIIVALAQLFVPAKMILNKETILETGTEFKFETRPLDPNDPFRGKYIHLRFIESEFEIENKGNWIKNEEIFVIIKNNKNGFAEISTVVKDKPSSDVYFIKAKVKYIHTDYISIEYPFERFYMEESKAEEAENLNILNTTNQNTIVYALVYVKNGETALKDVMINNKSIKEVVEENRQ